MLQGVEEPDTAVFHGKGESFVKPRCSDDGCIIYLVLVAAAEHYIHLGAPVFKPADDLGGPAHMAVSGSLDAV